jgi:hypothetical protein
MTQSASKPRFINNSARCNYRFPNGMRCRLIGFGSQPFCPKHTQAAAGPQPVVARQHNPAEVASTLTANLDDFTSAAQINDFLSRLLLLLAQDKISTRRAAVLAYITNQLLRTLPAIAKEENADSTTIIFDMPGPQRDSPETTPMQADVRTQAGQPLGGPPQPRTATNSQQHRQES